MDLDLLKHLTDEQKEKYKALTDMFGSPGWAILHKWAEVNYEESRERGSAATSWEANRIAFGNRVVYDVLRKTEEITELEYSEIARNNANENADPDVVDPDDLLSFEQ